MSLTAVLLVAVGEAPVYAQQPTLHDALLDPLTGKWVLRGTLAGRQATHDVVAQWVLGHAAGNGNSLRFLFKDRSDAGTFHTISAYDETAGAWGWRMDAEQQAGVLTPFARLKMTRRH